MLERLEDSFVSHFETGEAGTIENARKYLCEQETQECVGDPKQRLAERLAQQERERLAEQKKKGREVKGAKPEGEAVEKQAAVWTDMGVGCCGGWDDDKGYLLRGTCMPYNPSIDP